MLLVMGGVIYSMGFLFGRVKIVKIILQVIGGAAVLLALVNLFIIAWGLFT